MRVDAPKYRQLAEQTQRHLECTGNAGDRLLSLRDFASREGVSMSTALRVYEELERSGVVESRQRSGYFLQRSAVRQVALPTASREIPVARNEKELIQGLQSSAWHAHRFTAYFASGTPDTSTAGPQELGRIIRRVARRELEDYGPLPGDALLRQEIASRYVKAGMEMVADELMITSGAQEALFISINITTQPGDLIAVESPTYHGLISAIKQSGRRMVEIPTDSSTGINLPALGLALEELPVKAVVVSSSVQNPLGCSMNDESRRQLVALANAHDVTLVEDDTHGELLYARQRQRNLSEFDTQDRVIVCGSFSKTLAPELRVGWLKATGCGQAALDFKRAVSARSGLMPQQAIARHMAEGHYDRHIRLSRDTYARRGRALRAVIAQCFPRGTRISQPTGGFQMWVELPPEYSAMELAEYALSEGIAISPGGLFSHRGHYGHCLRLCYSRYQDENRASIELMGKWLSEMSPESSASQ
ncbi:MAG: PLP-dependent aminotransferase family protein [Granulosicoccus sp.]